MHAPLSGTNVRYLEMGQAIKAHGTFKLAHTDEYDDALHEMRKITIVDVAACIGGRSLEEYIFPVMIQALSDDEETVVAGVLTSLTSPCELGLFQRMRLWELMSDTLGSPHHPNMWIREGSIQGHLGASEFIAGETKNLPSTDVWYILYPSLKHFLRSDLRSISERSLLLTLKTPVYYWMTTNRPYIHQFTTSFIQLSRQVFDAAALWVMKADKTNFWKAQSSKARTVPKAETPKPELEAMGQTTSGVELQKLSVVPQTIFIVTRPSEVSTKAGSSRHGGRHSIAMDVTDGTTVHAYLVWVAWST
ncbi:hypothetical protein BU17DRAFT_72112 [Hysterangium stoloniferum]|nr:hypothetical protein BU17DRAFT_72112 [Hysterangium stoloniferum]